MKVTRYQIAEILLWAALVAVIYFIAIPKLCHP